jgi:hypothetical protein
MYVMAAQHWGLMNAMSNKAGLDLGSEYLDGNLSRSDLRIAVFTCTECSHVTECEAFLDQGGSVMEGIPDYCLIKPMIAALKAEGQLRVKTSHLSGLVG